MHPEHAEKQFANVIWLLLNLPEKVSWVESTIFGQCWSRFEPGINESSVGPNSKNSPSMSLLVFWKRLLGRPCPIRSTIFEQTQNLPVPNRSEDRIVRLRKGFGSWIPGSTNSKLKISHFSRCSRMEYKILGNGHGWVSAFQYHAMYWTNWWEL